MPTIEKYDQSKTLRDKILYVLSALEKASPREVAGEIIELEGISTEDSVEDISVEIENELDKLCEDKIVTKLKEHRQKRRYILNKNGKH
jgi:hypothetical protein